MTFLNFFAREYLCTFSRADKTKSMPILVNEASEFGGNSSLLLRCFLSEETTQFIYLRADPIARKMLKASRNVFVKSWSVPLALELAGAYIKILSCDLSSYLEL